MTEMYSVTVLEARTDIKALAGLAPPEAVREGFVPSISPWLVDGRLSVSLRSVIALCVCPQISPLSSPSYWIRA